MRPLLQSDLLKSGIYKRKLKCLNRREWQISSLFGQSWDGAWSQMYVFPFPTYHCKSGAKFCVINDSWWYPLNNGSFKQQADATMAAGHGFKAAWFHWKHFQFAYAFQSQTSRTGKSSKCFTDNKFGLITYRKYVPQTKSSKYQIQFSDEETGITNTTSFPGDFLSILYISGNQNASYTVIYIGNRQRVKTKITVRRKNETKWIK